MYITQKKLRWNGTENIKIGALIVGKCNKKHFKFEFWVLRESNWSFQARLWIKIADFRPRKKVRNLHLWVMIKSPMVLKCFNNDAIRSWIKFMLGWRDKTKNFETNFELFSLITFVVIQDLQKYFVKKKNSNSNEKKKIPFLYRHNTFEELLALLVKKKFFFFDSREKRKSDRNAICRSSISERKQNKRFLIQITDLTV